MKNLPANATQLRKRQQEHIRQLARAKGFPDDYQWYGTYPSIRRQIAEASHVGMMRAVIGAVTRHLRPDSTSAK